MPNKDGQYVTRLPTQYKSKKKKVLKKEGDKHNYSIEKCPVCSKQKMEKYDMKDNNGTTITTIRKCKNCNFVNGSTVFYNPPPENTPITYFKPSGSLEDKSEQK